jgi:hypothetical protein
LVFSIWNRVQYDLLLVLRRTVVGLNFYGEIKRSAGAVALTIHLLQVWRWLLYNGRVLKVFSIKHKMVNELLEVDWKRVLPLAIHCLEPVSRTHPSPLMRRGVMHNALDSFAN